MTLFSKENYYFSHITKHSKVMLLLLLANSLSEKNTVHDVEFNVVFTASCPNVNSTMLIINRGEQIIKPAQKGITYVPLMPGKHYITTTHPWCSFYDVKLTLNENGMFTAETNVTTYDEYPIKIKHEKNKSDDPIGLLYENNSLPMFIFLIGLFLFFKFYVCTSENMLKGKEYMENMKGEYEKLQEEANKQKLLQEQKSRKKDQ